MTIHRLAYAATHVVMHDAYRDSGHRLDAPGSSAEIAAAIDWEATMRLRRDLGALGFGIAEAMDTAQRFLIGWDSAARLIRDCGRLGIPRGFVAGAGTDHEPNAAAHEHDLVAAVCWQIEFIQENGGIPVILPMPSLSLGGATADDYVRVYGEIIQRSQGPLLLHWLGAMFLPALDGYFPGDSFDRVMALDPDKVRGCKLSLLDADHERRVRREIAPRGQIVLTGDDFHFGDLIGGTGDPTGTTRLGDLEVATGDFSHALLGVLDGIAAPASLALTALETGDRATYDGLMAPCERYGQHVFGAPTQHYKVGLAFTSWLAGRQDNWMLVNREDLARDREHLLGVADLAVECGAVPRDAPRLVEYRG